MIFSYVRIKSIVIGYGAIRSPVNKLFGTAVVICCDNINFNYFIHLLCFIHDSEIISRFNIFTTTRSTIFTFGTKCKFGVVTAFVCYLAYVLTFTVFWNLDFQRIIIANTNGNGWNCFYTINKKINQLFIHFRYIATCDVITDFRICSIPEAIYWIKAFKLHISVYLMHYIIGIMVFTIIQKLTQFFASFPTVNWLHIGIHCWLSPNLDILWRRLSGGCCSSKLLLLK